MIQYSWRVVRSFSLIWWFQNFDRLQYACVRVCGSKKDMAWNLFRHIFNACESRLMWIALWWIYFLLENTMQFILAWHLFWNVGFAGHVHQTVRLNDDNECWLKTDSKNYYNIVDSALLSALILRSSIFYGNGLATPFNFAFVLYGELRMC